jgi:hypothetical protein
MLGSDYYPFTLQLVKVGSVTTHVNVNPEYIYGDLQMAELKKRHPKTPEAVLARVPFGLFLPNKLKRKAKKSVMLSLKLFKKVEEDKRRKRENLLKTGTSA